LLWKLLLCDNSLPSSNEGNPDSVGWTGSFGRRCGAYIQAGLMPS
jgi:hypothetical protein